MMPSSPTNMKCTSYAHCTRTPYALTQHCTRITFVKATASVMCQSHIRWRAAPRHDKPPSLLPVVTVTSTEISELFNNINHPHKSCLKAPIHRQDTWRNPGHHSPHKRAVSASQLREQQDSHTHNHNHIVAHTDSRTG